MPRDNSRSRANPASRNPPARAARACVFCVDHREWVDYKDTGLLGRFMTDRGKIRARRLSGNCATHQRDVAAAIKSARELALLPYAQRTQRPPRTQHTQGERGPRRGPVPVQSSEPEEVDA